MRVGLEYAVLKANKKYVTMYLRYVRLISLYSNKQCKNKG